MKSSKIKILCIILLLNIGVMCYGENHIISLNITIQKDTLTVAPSLYFNTTEQIKEAIDNGIKIHLIVKTQVYEPKKWWFDTSLRNNKFTLEVSYFTLSKLYVVKNLKTGKQISFNQYNQLWSELEKLAVIEIDTTTNEKTWVQMRIMLDKGALPTVMQLPTLFNSDWQIDTQWYHQKIIQNE